MNNQEQAILDSYDISLKLLSANFILIPKPDISVPFYGRSIVYIKSPGKIGMIRKHSNFKTAGSVLLCEAVLI